MFNTQKEIRPWVGDNPSNVFLYPTMLCNLNCKMCYSGGHKDKKRALEEELSFEDYKAIIDELYENGIRNYDISGGEPFLRDDVYSIFEYIKTKKDTYLQVVCNGTVLVNVMQKLEPCFKYIDQLNISFDSTIPEEHNRIRNTDNAFQLSCMGLDKLKSKGFKQIGINSVIMNENSNQVRELLDMAVIAEVKHINFLRFIDVGGDLLQDANLKMQGLVDTYTTIQEWISDKKAKSNSLELHITLVLPGWFMEEFGKLRKRDIGTENISIEVQFDPIRGCPAFGNSIIVTSIGNLTGCTAMIKIPEMFVGNVVNEKYSELIPRIKEMRSLVKKREHYLKTVLPCASCKNWIFCRGGCPAAAYHYYGSIMKHDPTCMMV